ncbi:hypothetical protein M0L20_22235 [Spirosoma sp. RP8]|uniref:Uncharacterized protein n=1 Tax=Spirosoma liriopis TaxID=2937440 RepID=A0ABT0HR03_9BACT|nr:hypothetical protein [Spirosoma liriopis]MCK8494604.1 hypothetical protein [Spirosoma liriopis]
MQRQQEFRFRLRYRPSLPAEALTLRLVGWDGSRWIDLSGKPSISGGATSTCSLIGTIISSITELAIGSTSRSVFANSEEGFLSLTVWPNPTQDRLNVAVPTGQTISKIQVLDLQVAL